MEGKKITQDEKENKEFIEQVLRINPDIIYINSTESTIQTSEAVREIFKNYRNKDINIITNKKLEADSKDSISTYEEIIKKEAGKTTLIIAHQENFDQIRSKIYNTKTSGEKIKRAIQLPTYTISNELDKWILAELNNLGLQLEQEMDKYFLDTSAKLVLGFVEKLNNRFIRRSRRRFRASGMDTDKNSAFNTLFEVLQSYMKICASFAPFITEHIYLELQNFTTQGKIP
ncbi:MAG: class I tRNA ligase family protein [bacterium]